MFAKPLLTLPLIVWRLLRLLRVVPTEFSSGGFPGFQRRVMFVKPLPILLLIVWQLLRLLRVVSTEASSGGIVPSDGGNAAAKVTIGMRSVRASRRAS